MKESENYVKTTRKTLGLTQKQLAEKLNINANYVYLLESGKNKIGKKTLEKLKELEIQHQNNLESEPSNKPNNSDIPFCVQCAIKNVENQGLRNRLLDSSKLEMRLSDEIIFLRKQLNEAYSFINTDGKNPAK